MTLWTLGSQADIFREARCCGLVNPKPVSSSFCQALVLTFRDPPCYDKATWKGSWQWMADSSQVCAFRVSFRENEPT